METPQDFSPDSVGFPWPGNRMKIAPDGELLVQGISVSKGYHNLPEATAEAYIDGWFKTGDLASIDDRGHLRITGRKKELIVTAGGKNVSPEILEAQAANLPEVRDSLEKAIARANKAVSRAESIRRYRIVNAAFTVENGYMTPSLKLKRRRVLADYADEVDALYASGEAAKNQE